MQECTDDRKDKPVLGLEIIRGAKKAEGKDVGRRQDSRPENGRNYTLRLTPIEGGKKLEVRGSIGPSAARRPGSASSNPHSVAARAPAGGAVFPNKEPNPCPDSK